jgi:hypothetical protein
MILNGYCSVRVSSKTPMRGQKMSVSLTCSLDEKASNKENIVIRFSDSIPGALYTVIEAAIKNICTGTWVRFFWTTAGDRLRVMLPRNAPTLLICMIKDWVRKFQPQHS